MSEVQNPGSPLVSVSPTPPCQETYFDTKRSNCALCLKPQIHDTTWEELHSTCSCYLEAACCSAGYEQYLRDHFDTIAAGNKPYSLPTLSPKMTLMTRILHLSCLSVKTIEDPSFATQCDNILSKIQLEYELLGITENLNKKLLNI